MKARYSLLILFTSLMAIGCVSRAPMPSDRDTSKVSISYRPYHARGRHARKKRSKIDRYLMELTSIDPAVRTGAATNIGMLRAKARIAVPALAKALHYDSNKWVRRSAAKALGKIRGTRAIKALKRGLHDSDPWVSHSAKNALRGR